MVGVTAELGPEKDAARNTGKINNEAKVSVTVTGVGEGKTRAVSFC